MGAAPLGAVPLSSLWPLVITGQQPGVHVAQTAANEPPVWLAEIAPPALIGRALAPPVGMPGALPLSALTLPDVASGDMAPLRVSDAGWIGEPEDADAPNQVYAPRLVEPPAVEMAIPIYWDQSRRSALAAGELVIRDGDGAAAAWAADWRVAGKSVVISRGPHRRPRHAPRRDFRQVAVLRAAAALGGDADLRLPLASSARDLDVPACDTYAGTGGAEGPASLAGTNKPRLYGRRRNVTPVSIDPALLLYQIAGANQLQAVHAVRDRGAAYAAGNAHAAVDALLAAVVAGGTYDLCLASGHIRLGSTPSSLTVDATGEAGGSLWSIASALMRGPGGIGADRVWPYDAWPDGAAGLYLTGGTVADAIDALAAGVAAWWGSDAYGRYASGWPEAPDQLSPLLVLDPWDLAEAPEEVEASRVPVWRVRVGYRTLDTVQAGEDLAGSVSASDRDTWGRAARTVQAADDAVRRAWPAALDGPELVSALDDASAAQAVADRLLALWSRPRRAWRVVVRRDWTWLRPGAAVLLQWPGIPALRSGRTLLLRDISAVGDRAELVLWG